MRVRVEIRKTMVVVRGRRVETRKTMVVRGRRAEALMH